LGKGVDVPKKITLSNEIDLRASCGCGEQVSYSENVYNINKVIQSEFLLREAGRITADYQNRYDIENALSVANYYFYTLGCDTGYICLSDMNDPNFRNIETNKIYSDEMLLMQRMRSSERTKAEIFDARFNKDDILPKEIFDQDRPGAYIIFPLYYKSKEYGFLVIHPSEGQWPNSLTNTYTNSLSAALENSYNQIRFSELAEIKRLSETDPLTGLYNRRGFENGLAGILSSCKEGTTISIASIDMDDLKSINDLYGHADGDFALKMLANVLKTFIHEGELCARFGGDEFSAVLVSDRPGRIEEFVNAFAISLSEASKKSGKPYPIHASIGISDLKGGDNQHIFACMQLADKLMYMNKRKYKIRNK
ncbi:MAG: GGDEF domain-containing protein, partial [Clostridiales bacterium]|nr:GGDEF domain-containing protein [Clostridiales bacterium]